ncbi:MAG: oxidoreductase, partial [Devosia sp.]|nr:oxidoreductase [Devosia sp.]
MTNPAFFITGGGSGMGRAAALHFARQGARIALFDAADTGLKQVQDQLRSEGLECLTFKGDVRSRAELDSAIAQTHAAFGGLNRLVCAAGILRSGRLAELSEDV